MTFNPEYAYAPFNIGFIYYYELEDAQEALNYFTRATEVNPNYAEAWFMKGMVFESLKQKENAREQYQTTLKINKEHKGANERLKAIGV
jgi:tetratricopeptide (TPR) repeat protein